MTETKLTSSTAPIPKPETSTCSVCGAIHPLTDLIAVECYLYCHNCLDRETVICSHCGNRILFDDNAGTEDFPLCQNCYDNHYTSCARCGSLIHQDDACYDDDDKSDISESARLNKTLHVRKS